MNGIDEFKKMCLEVEKKSNKLKADINTFIAKYQSLGDCPLEESGFLNNQNGLMISISPMKLQKRKSLIPLSANL